MGNLIIVVLLIILFSALYKFKSKRKAAERIQKTLDNPYSIYKKNILLDDFEILRKPSEALEFPLSQEERLIGVSLKEYVQNSRNDYIAKKLEIDISLGISAPQINHFKRMFAMYNEHSGEYLIVINPEILEHSNKQLYSKSGEICLSVSKAFRKKGYVHRYKTISVRYYDLRGNIITQKFTGSPAMVFQHELDHLDGKLYLDRIDMQNPHKMKKTSKPYKKKRLYNFIKRTLNVLKQKNRVD